MASSIRTRLDIKDPWERYTRLPPGPKFVLQLKSLVFLPTGKTEFYYCIVGGGVRTPERRPWTGPTINGALDLLRREQLLTDALACVPSLLHPVAIDAIAAPGAEQMIAAVRRSFPVRPDRAYYQSNPQPDPEPFLRLARLAIYANDEAAFIAERDHHDRAYAPQHLAAALGTLFRSAPFSAYWFESRAPAIQLALFEGRVAAFLSGDLAEPDTAALIARYRTLQDQPGFGLVRRVLLEHDVLSLRFAEARAMLPQLDEADALLRLSTEATLHFLAGENSAAIEFYRAALKQRRKQEGRRKAFLPGIHGLFFLMALLRTGNVALHGEIQAGLDTLPLAELAKSGWIAVQMLLWLAQGLEGKAHEQSRLLARVEPTDPLSKACRALADHAIDPNISRQRAAELAARFEFLKNTLRLPARIYAEILAEVAGTPDRYLSFLETTGADVGVAFIHLIQKSPSWERALQSLDAFLFADPSKGGAEPATRRAKRLAWFVDPETLEIDVAEQSPKGRDGWTDGRAVAMKRLYEQDPRLDYLTPQDRRALRTLRREKDGLV